MNEAEKQKIIGELEDFYKELKSYKRLLNLKGRLSDKDRLREILVRKAGALKPIIIELTGKEYISRFGMAHNIWDVGLTAHRISDICDVALDYCIDAVNEAIGKLESDIKTGIRDKQGNVIRGADRTERQLELILEGTPDMIIECVMNFVKKLNSKGYVYKCVPKIGDGPDFAKQDRTYSARCAIFETREGGEEQIGIIRLTLLPKDQTLLSISEPEDWESSFGLFLSYLLGEFKRLGFVYFEEEKPPIGFRLPHREKNV